MTTSHSTALSMYVSKSQNQEFQNLENQLRNSTSALGCVSLRRQAPFQVWEDCMEMLALTALRDNFTWGQWPGVKSKQSSKKRAQEEMKHPDWRVCLPSQPDPGAVICTCSQRKAAFPGEPWIDSSHRKKVVISNPRTEPRTKKP